MVSSVESRQPRTVLQRKTLMQIINYTSNANDIVSPAKYNFA